MRVRNDSDFEALQRLTFKQLCEKVAAEHERLLKTPVRPPTPELLPRIAALYKPESERSELESLCMAAACFSTLGGGEEPTAVSYQSTDRESEQFDEAKTEQEIAAQRRCAKEEEAQERERQRNQGLLGPANLKLRPDPKFPRAMHPSGVTWAQYLAAKAPSTPEELLRDGRAENWRRWRLEGEQFAWEVRGSFEPHAVNGVETKLHPNPSGKIRSLQFATRLDPKGRPTWLILQHCERCGDVSLHRKPKHARKFTCVHCSGYAKRINRAPTPEPTLPQLSSWSSHVTRKGTATQGDAEQWSASNGPRIQSWWSSAEEKQCEKYAPRFERRIQDHVRNRIADRESQAWLEKHDLSPNQSTVELPEPLQQSQDAASLHSTANATSPLDLAARAEADARAQELRTVPREFDQPRKPGRPRNQAQDQRLAKAAETPGETARERLRTVLRAEGCTDAEIEACLPTLEAAFSRRR
jgi:hypothetical protein